MKSVENVQRNGEAIVTIFPGYCSRSETLNETLVTQNANTSSGSGEVDATAGPVVTPPERMLPGFGLWKLNSECCSY